MRPRDMLLVRQESKRKNVCGEYLIRRTTPARESLPSERVSQGRVP